MYTPRFEFESFETIPIPDRLRILVLLLEALAGANVVWLQNNRAPPLLSSGIVYRREPPGRDNWQDIPRTIALGNGDCEDIASWRVAELRARGEDAQFRVDVYEDRNKAGQPMLDYHIRVARSDGTIEDPSRTLGMR